jgi:hypothetical protein
MLKQVSQREIKENWEFYKEQIKVAFTSSEGGIIFTDNSSEQGLREIYERLINPFNHTMHLWSEGEDNYIAMTQLQVCEFTDQKTLVLFSCTRTKDVDKEKLEQIWFDCYNVISEFARSNSCLGMICYSDLEHFAEMAKKTQEWSKVHTRYQFYFPL